MQNQTSAIQNLDFLRQLITEARDKDESGDDQGLRMLRNTGMGTDAMTNQHPDRGPTQ